MSVNLDRAAVDRILALAGHVRPALYAALLKHPERWDDVLADTKRPVA